MDLQLHQARFFTSLETGTERELVAMTVTERGETTLTLDCGEVWRFTPYEQICHKTGWNRVTGDAIEYTPQKIDLSLLTPDNIQSAGRRVKDSDFAEIIFKKPNWPSTTHLFGSLRVLHPATKPPSIPELPSSALTEAGEAHEPPKAVPDPTEPVPTDSLNHRQRAAREFLRNNAASLRNIVGGELIPSAGTYNPNVTEHSLQGQQRLGHTLPAPDITTVKVVVMGGTAANTSQASARAEKADGPRRAYTPWPKPAQKALADLWLAARAQDSNIRECDFYDMHKGTDRLPTCIRCFEDLKACKEAAEKNGFIPRLKKARGKTKGKSRQ